MSERGQKIFKWIVWLVIATIFIVKVVDLAIVIKDAMVEPITRVEWMEQLADGFGDPSIAASVEEGELFTTGEYAAITAMDAIGEKRLAYLSDEELTNQKKINIALQYGVVEKRSLDKKISEEKANEII